MELALLVWVISTLKPITILLAISGVILIFVFLGMMVDYANGHRLKTRWYWITGTAAAVLITLSAIIPSERTAYLMVGAYAAQKIAEDPKVQQISSKVLKAIELKIDGYIEEASKEINPAPIDKK